MASKKVWGLFERYGIELEYMICDQKTLQVLPITDQVIFKLTGAFPNEVQAGAISYSNELALHVIELKTTDPVETLDGVDRAFQDHVIRLNTVLQDFGACLMPTGMHPWMDPYSELRLWNHEANPIYEAYHRIFDCRGHGWANLQSVHVNLSFSTDEEFRALHSAIRWLLPIMPALSASSPAIEGRLTGVLDTRLEMYRHNQKRIPSIAGNIIPEPVSSVQEYYDVILKPIWKDILPHDPEHLLQEEWLNSRGAIARFDRSAIEIRVLDIQECPAMDIAIAQGIVSVLKLLVAKIRSGEIPFNFMATKNLANILFQCIVKGENTPITDLQYGSIFGVAVPTTAGKIWEHLLQLTGSNSALQRRLIEQGTLASRITRRWKESEKGKEGKDLYRALVDCLATGRPF
jgi:hypothetical protein